MYFDGLIMNMIIKIIVPIIFNVKTCKNYIFLPRVYNIGIGTKLRMESTLVTVYRNNVDQTPFQRFVGEGGVKVLLWMVIEIMVKPSQLSNVF